MHPVSEGLACGTAEEPAEIGEFGRDNNSKSGRKGSCRVCCSEASRESTARTKGRAYECSSDIPEVKAGFPSFAATIVESTPEPNKASARTRQPRSSSTPEADTSPLVEIDESEWPRPKAPGGYTVWPGITLPISKSKDFFRELFNLEKKSGM